MSHRDGFEEQIACRIDALDVGRKGAIRRDHVGHFFDGIDVRHVEVAVLVRERVVRVVAHGRRGRTFGDAEHSDAGRRVFAVETCARIVQHGLKYGLACAVYLARIAVHAFGIGEVAGRRIEADRFRIESATRHVEYTEQRHEYFSLANYWPAMANWSSEILPLMNVRLAW